MECIDFVSCSLLVFLIYIHSFPATVLYLIYSLSCSDFRNNGQKVQKIWMIFLSI